MTYDEAIAVCKLVVNQYKNGYHISQTDYNNYKDALALLLTVSEKVYAKL